MVKSLPVNAVTTDASILAGLGEELQILTVITSTRETLEFLGTTLPKIQKAAPRRYEYRVRRNIERFSGYGIYRSGGKFESSESGDCRIDDGCLSVSQRRQRARSRLQRAGCRGRERQRDRTRRCGDL